MAKKTLILLAHDADGKDWVSRLTLYLAPLRRKGVFDVWDERSIRADGRVEDARRAAIGSAAAAVMLIGPAFIGSDEWMDQVALPVLARAKEGEIKLYPVLVGHCNYAATELGPYKLVNDPNKPLEALATHDQNAALNALCVQIDKDLQGVAPPAPLTAGEPLRATMERVAKHLSDTRLAFVSQAKRRDALVAALRARLGHVEKLEYEKLFLRYFAQMTPEELFEHQQIRAVTEGILYPSNRALFDLIEETPALVAAVPRLADLRQHLVFWLNKYERVFTRTEEMCLLYVGVEDAVPFPLGLDEEIELWLERAPERHGGE